MRIGRLLQTVRIHNSQPGQFQVTNQLYYDIDQKVVHEFHDKAIAAGGKDNGQPGPRPQYGPSYYGAFIIDPVGNNVEVICRK